MTWIGRGMVAVGMPQKIRESAPRPPLLDALLSAADAAQKEAILAAARSAGLLWRCPACQWGNPAAASCCEGPRPCRTARPVIGVDSGRELREP